MPTEDNIVVIDTAAAKRSITVTVHYQYDTGLKVRLLNIPVISGCTFYLEMCNAGDQEIKYEFPYTGQDTEIPEDLLLNKRDTHIYIYVKGENWGKTVFEIVLKVTRRPSR